VRHNFKHDSSIAIDDERGYVIKLIKYVLAHDAAIDTCSLGRLHDNLDLSYNQSGQRLTDREE
jgi:hypothetical protein